MTDFLRLQPFSTMKLFTNQDGNVEVGTQIHGIRI